MRLKVSEYSYLTHPFIFLCFPDLQHPLPVLSRHCGPALPLRVAAHLHSRAPPCYARHRLHSDAVHRRPAVQFSPPADRASPGRGRRFNDPFAVVSSFKKYVRTIWPFCAQVLVVDLENSRLLRQVRYSQSHFSPYFIFAYQQICFCFSPLCCMQLDDEDSILPSKLQSALETVLERRRELANERGGDTATGKDPKATKSYTTCKI